MAFIRSVTAYSSQRFFAYAIGEGNEEEIRKWVNFSFSLHIVFSVVLIIVAIPVGYYLIGFVMQIPAERIGTCYFVYYLSIFGAVITLLSTPSYAILLARQRIFELSFWDTIRGVLSFGLAWYLLKTSGNLLLFYAIGMVVISVFICLVQWIRARNLFCECKLNTAYWFDKDRFQQLLSYSGWFSFAAFCSVIKNQGLALLLNIFCGANVNAAYGLANQVGSQTSAISSTVYSAIVPELSTCEGRGDRKRVVMLTLRSSKFVTLITFLWLVPLFVEMNFVLSLWLKDVPDYAAAFCRIILIAYLFEKISIGYIGALHAAGQVKGIESWSGICYLLSFPLAYIALKNKCSPTIALLPLILVSMAVAYSRLYWGKRTLNIAYSKWIFGVAFRSLWVLIPSASVAYVIFHYFETSFSRLVIISFACGTCTLITSYIYGLIKDEKIFIKSKINFILRRFQI